MDDFNVSSLHESKNEWGSRLLTILTPLLIDGYKSILEEATKICKENDEMNKYLMTFQNFISRIPKWNPAIIERERSRICDKSGCVYLEELITCVHIIQLKLLTSMRVGQKQKKIDINIPKLDDFIHKVYINTARKLYKNIYLFELNVAPLQAQKNNREIEIIIQECILNTVRESIPVEAILKAYMDETVEEDIIEEVKEEIVEEPVKENINVTSTPNSQHVNNISPTNNSPSVNNSSPINSSPINSHLSFNDIDYVKDNNNNVVSVTAPKTIERLEEISEIRAQQRKLSDTDDDDDNENVKLNISNESVDLGALDIQTIYEPKLELLPDLLLDEIEVLN
jgi:hypothetical protein